MIVYEVWVEFDSNDTFVEDDCIGIFTTEEKADKAIEIANQIIKRDDIQDVREIVKYTKDLDKNYWEV